LPRIALFFLSFFGLLRLSKLTFDTGFDTAAKIEWSIMAHGYRLYHHPNGTYYHRVKVPSDVRALYGKDIEQKSLRTRVLREAIRLLPAVIVEADLRFEALRTGFTSEHRLPVVRLQAIKRQRSEPIPQPNRLPIMSVIGSECFVSVGRTKKWSAKTQATRANQLRQFIAICGDKALDEYTQMDIRHLKSVLFALPPSPHSQHSLRSLPKAEIAGSASSREGRRGLSVESVRQVMTAVNIVFGWARAEFDSKLVNIVQPMIPKPASGGDRRAKRDGFSIAELSKLFHSPVFTGVKSSSSWFEAGTMRMHHTGRFWIPLLSLYAGMRLMEAVQLLRDDVRHEDGIWFIDVNGDDQISTGKTLKTLYSARRIPLHSALIKLGFLEYIATIEKGWRLFADVEIGPPAQRHRYASKMFNRLLERAEIKGPKKVWHSLRHTFEQACRDSRVDSAIMDQLQGHAQGTRGVYGEGYNVAALNDGIQSIRYDGLDLSHIEPFKICGA
jgi:integrase